MQRNNGYIGGKVLNNAGGVQDLYDRYVISQDENQNNSTYRSTGLTGSQWWSTGAGYSGWMYSYGGTNYNYTYIQQTTLAAHTLRALRRKTVRLVFHYTSGSGFRGDWQIGWFNIGDGTKFYDTSATPYRPWPIATSYHFHDGQGLSDWETTTANSTSITYDNAVWSTVSSSETTNANRWNYRQTGSSGTGATPSNNTGTTWPHDGDYSTFGGAFLYAEASGSGYSNKDFWLRSKPIYLGDNPRVSWWNGRYGSNMGSLSVHVDIVRGGGIHQ